MRFMMESGHGIGTEIIGSSSVLSVFHPCSSVAPLCLSLVDQNTIRKISHGQTRMEHGIGE